MTEDVIDLSSDSEEEINGTSKNTTKFGKNKFENLQIRPNKKKGILGLKTVQSLGLHSKFMEDFDPNNSNREKRKLFKKFAEPKPTSHSLDGMIVGTNIDLCDCLMTNCVGCFFPCPTCRSCKCGFDCRNKRKYIIEAVENEANNQILKNVAISENDAECD